MASFMFSRLFFFLGVVSVRDLLVDQAPFRRGPLSCRNFSLIPLFSAFPGSLGFFHEGVNSNSFLRPSCRPTSISAGKTLIGF